MCGIAGVVSFDSRFLVGETYLSRLRDEMISRGPDGQGNWISKDQRVGLAHRRLAILDLSSAAGQPMCNEDESVWVVFNGEIYNHAEIRKELESRAAYRWKTDHSDTEVILHAFEEWGIDCVHKFRGMFAFALWDERNKELWLVRDRIGIKPLYYSIHHGRLVFASEIKALLQDPDQARKVNEEQLFHFLSFLTTPAPNTLFEGIHKLPGGSWLRIRLDGSIVERRYWEVWDHVQPRVAQNEDTLAQELLQELRVAVKLRKMSDVPVGVFLSGGIDSSINAVLFSEGERDPVQTFSIGYDKDYSSYPSELRFARQIANRLGAQHHERILNLNDLLQFVPIMVRLQDEPIADPVCVPVYYVSELARRKGVIVCQVGEGSDELFWGYRNWRVKLRLQQMNDFPLPRVLKRIVSAGLNACGKSDTHYAELLRRGISEKPIFWGGAEGFSAAEKASLLADSLKRRFRNYSSWEALEPIHQRFRQKAWEPSILHWMTYLDLHIRLPELLLMRVDKMSMGVSLEARVPFLDHKFVEFALGIPESVKTRNGELKAILKRAVRGAIPDSIIDRKKQGFGVPIQEWLMGKLGRVSKAVLSEFCETTNYLDAKTVELYLSKHSPQSWILLNFALWWNTFIAPGSLKTASALSTAVPSTGLAIGSSSYARSVS